MTEKLPHRELTKNTELVRIQKIVELFEIGLDNDEGSIGYHGTSLEALEFLIKEGYLPGGTGTNLKETDVQHGDLHFFPLKSKFASHAQVGTFPDESEILDDVAIYAEGIAGEHYLLRKLNFDLSDQKHGYMARILARRSYDLDYQEAYTQMLLEGVDKKVLDAAIEGASKRKGVVIALSMQLLETYTPVDGDPGDLKIHFPKGLDLNGISGIEPMSTDEYDYLDRLQNDQNF